MVDRWLLQILKHYLIPQAEFGAYYNAVLIGGIQDMAIPDHLAILPFISKGKPVAPPALLEALIKKIQNS